MVGRREHAVVLRHRWVVAVQLSGVPGGGKALAWAETGEMLPDMGEAPCFIMLRLGLGGARGAEAAATAVPGAAAALVMGVPASSGLLPDGSSSRGRMGAGMACASSGHCA